MRSLLHVAPLALLPLLATPAMTGCATGPHVVPSGGVPQAVAAANPIIAFAALGLRQMLATDIRHEHKFSRYFGLRIVCLAVAMAVLGGT